VRRSFARKTAEVVEDNARAARAGYEAAVNLGVRDLTLSPAAHAEVEGRLLLDGAEAVSLVAIAGGCNFVSSYPMSPSTPVLDFSRPAWQ